MHTLDAQCVKHSESKKDDQGHTDFGAINHRLTHINNLHFSANPTNHHINNSHIHEIIPTQFDDTRSHNFGRLDMHVQSEVEKKVVSSSNRSSNDSLMHDLQLHKLPGFRFHPTEHELVGFYLKRKVEGLLPPLDLIPHVDLYLHDPWELSAGMEKSLQREWFFFVARDSKYSDGGRPNRRTKCGFWKATGIDKIVKVNLPDTSNSSSVSNHCHGLRKTLVYYKGRAPLGVRTHWIMNEYRLSYNSNTNHAIKENLQSLITLCKVYKKSLPIGVNEGRTAESLISKSHTNKVSISDYIYNHNSVDVPKSPPYSKVNLNDYQQESCINNKDESTNDGSWPHKVCSSELPHHFWEHCVQMTTMSSSNSEHKSNEPEEQTKLISMNHHKERLVEI